MRVYRSVLAGMVLASLLLAPAALAPCQGDTQAAPCAVRYLDGAVEWVTHRGD